MKYNEIEKIALDLDKKLDNNDENESIIYESACKKAKELLLVSLRGKYIKKMADDEVIACKVTDISVNFDSGYCRPFIAGPSIRINNNIVGIFKNSETSFTIKELEELDTSDTVSEITACEFYEIFSTAKKMIKNIKM